MLLSKCPDKFLFVKCKESLPGGEQASPITSVDIHELYDSLDACRPAQWPEVPDMPDITVEGGLAYAS